MPGDELEHFGHQTLLLLLTLLNMVGLFLQKESPLADSTLSTLGVWFDDKVIGFSACTAHGICDKFLAG